MEKWIEELKKKRKNYGISGKRLAHVADISVKHLYRIESGIVKNISGTIKESLKKSLDILTLEAPLTLIFDYVRLRFPVTDVKYIVERVLKLRFDRFIHEPYGFYGYPQQYHMRDIVLYFSDENTSQGVLLELKGKGCREFECHLFLQERNWYDFFNDCYGANMIVKRLDLAINDHAGILDIPALTEKCGTDACVSKFRSFDKYASGRLLKEGDQHKAEMGYTLYLGSKSSEIYFCIYQKDYEQYVKMNIPMEEAPIINRFEIRLTDERAENTMNDLMENRDMEGTVFGIINQYVCFLEVDETKDVAKWGMDKAWELFIGEHRNHLKLTNDPVPYNIDSTANWLAHQVSKTYEMFRLIDEQSGSTYLKDIFDNVELDRKHKKIVQQIVADHRDHIMDDKMNNE
ncbi:MAG: replication initiation factor domain-containing protein [Lachnospiraceae bacterium]